MSYRLDKEKNKKNAKISQKNFKGFKLKPHNTINYDGVQVNQLMIIKPSFVEKVLKKKTKRKLELYLEFIIDILENEDGTDGSKITIALNDLERYKSIVKNNYRIYLENSYYKSLMKKISIIEKELKVRKMYFDLSLAEEYQMQEKSRRSR